MIIIKKYKIYCTILLSTMVLMFTYTPKTYSQEVIIPLIVGGTINQSVNNTPGDGALTIGLNLVKERRTYGLAIIFDEEEKINGAEFVHKIFINKKKALESYNIRTYSLRPYIVYNLVYKRAISKTQKTNNLIIDGSDLYSVSKLETPERVTTIQHYIGLGIEKDIFQHVFINISALSGLQLGKNNNNNKLDSSAGQRQENTYSWNIKLGFGYRF